MSDRLPVRAGAALEMARMEHEIRGRMLEVQELAATVRTSGQKRALAMKLVQIQDEITAYEGVIVAMGRKGDIARDQSFALAREFQFTIDSLQGDTDPAVIAEIAHQRNLTLGAISEKLQDELMELYDGDAYRAPEPEMTVFEKLFIGRARERRPPVDLMTRMFGPKKEGY